MTGVRYRSAQQSARKTRRRSVRRWRRESLPLRSYLSATAGGSESWVELRGGKHRDKQLGQLGGDSSLSRFVYHHQQRGGKWGGGLGEAKIFTEKKKRGKIQLQHNGSCSRPNETDDAEVCFVFFRVDFTPR